jgi:hypothetical protein
LTSCWRGLGIVSDCNGMMHPLGSQPTSVTTGS